MFANPPTLDELRARPTLTVAEAAQVLGIGRNTAYIAVHTGDLPSLRIGGRVLIPTARLFALLEGDDA
ncbi:helix-turn-helix domain-containing protein [Cryobacterium sp. Y50]|uniref:helix-turn-helix domain-containing protein n=1 Tax=Cryobacterium sp. Y50 TaxID=2048286 RepID=UPI000CE528B0|nr:helix-turn-helix domain-containing protein [Cryobacterium sp. Y50]